MSELQVASMPPRRAPLTPVVAVRHVLNLAPMILVHIGALGVFWLDVTARDWWVLLAFVYVRGIFVTVGYHRYFAHRSFKTSRLVQFLMACGCCGNLQQGPLWWAVYHRHHHRNSDMAGDPHSPLHGFWWAWCGWLFIPLDPDWKTVTDLRRYPELVWLERFWQLPGVFFVALCWWVGGWQLVCFGFCLSAVISFHMTFLVNTVAHLVGSRRYNTPDHSRNSLLLAAVTMGDGWHNNHHHYPNAAHAGFRWWEIDPSFRIIRLLEILGVIWSVHRLPAHKFAPESALTTIDAAPIASS